MKRVVQARMSVLPSREDEVSRAPQVEDAELVRREEDARRQAGLIRRREEELAEKRRQREAEEARRRERLNQVFPFIELLLMQEPQVWQIMEWQPLPMYFLSNGILQNMLLQQMHKDFR